MYHHFPHFSLTLLATVLFVNGAPIIPRYVSGNALSKVSAGVYNRDLKSIFERGPQLLSPVLEDAPPLSAVIGTYHDEFAQNFKRDSPAAGIVFNSPVGDAPPLSTFIGTYDEEFPDTFKREPQLLSSELDDAPPLSAAIGTYRDEFTENFKRDSPATGIVFHNPLEDAPPLSVAIGTLHEDFTENFKRSSI